MHPTGTPVRRRGLRRAAAVLAVATALAACSSGSGSGGGQNAAPVTGVTEVSMHNLKFDPPAIQVPVGTTVTWRFTDGSVPHNVKGDGLSSPTQSRGTFTHKFDRAGTFQYRCTLHAAMTGEVVVK
jgi:plastocyanin